MFDVRFVDEKDVQRVLALEEGHYLDLKAIEIAPSKMSITVSAFANTAGGELFLGVGESKNPDGTKIRAWRGFNDQEAANAHIQVLESLSPLGTHYKISFMQAKGLHGLVCQIIIFKTKAIITATNGFAYVRRGAQNRKVEGDEALARLRLDKGIVSFETETVDIPPERITNSSSLIGFMIDVVPSAEPEDWTRKQNLLTAAGKPTVAGVLLFDDEPQAALPKRSAIKVYRYKTKKEGERDTLVFDPITIEGCLYEQIDAAVTKTKSLVEEISRLGEKGLESVIYPDETLHEIITNAVLHRDYSIAADVHIRIYDNRIEVESPGRLPGHVTPTNILDEQAARNPQIVRLINKFPNPPNKDVGEGLNTAFEAMKKLKLKEPTIEEKDHSVLINIRHDTLASPHEAVMAYLTEHDEITNSIGRDLTGITSENIMKDAFIALKKRGMIEPVPGKKGSASAWRKVLKSQGTTGEGTAGPTTLD